MYEKCSSEEGKKKRWRQEVPAARQNPRDAKRYKENVLQANWDWEKKKKEEGVWFYRGSFEHLFFWGPHPPDLGISSKVAASAKRARKMKAAPTSSTALLANHGVCFPIYYYSRQYFMTCVTPIHTSTHLLLALPTHQRANITKLLRTGWIY